VSDADRQALFFFSSITLLCIFVSFGNLETIQCIFQQEGITEEGASLRNSGLKRGSGLELRNLQDEVNGKIKEVYLLIIHDVDTKWG
jgi:hypothetical protein